MLKRLLGCGAVGLLMGFLLFAGGCDRKATTSETETETAEDDSGDTGRTGWSGFAQTATTPQIAIENMLNASKDGDAAGIAACFDFRTPEEEQFIRTMADMVAASRQLQLSGYRKFGKETWRKAMVGGMMMGPVQDLDEFDMSKVTVKETGDRATTMFEGNPGPELTRRDGIWRLKTDMPPPSRRDEAVKQIASMTEVIRRTHARIDEAKTPDEIQDILREEAQRTRP